LGAEYYEIYVYNNTLYGQNADLWLSDTRPF